GDGQLFDGLITDVRPMGLMVEIPDMGVRGVVKREELPSGSRWRFEAHRKAWVSFDGKVIQLGMRIPLKVAAINMERRFVDFKIAGRPTSEGTRPLNAPPMPPPRKHQKPQPKPKPAAKAGPQKSKGGPAKAGPPKSKGPVEISRYSTPGKNNGKKRRR
ncbi:MAG: S1 RNA-binding domain-containing protein, partial [Verrucomicrobiaceae bacterium]